LVIDSPQVGVMHAATVVLDQTTLNTRVLGPGVLRARGQPGLLEAVDPAARLRSQRAGLPKGTTVRWADVLDLQFKRFSDDKGSRLALDTARFDGDITVQHPSFDFTSETLAFALAPGDDGRQAIQQINAS